MITYKKYIKVIIIILMFVFEISNAQDQNYIDSLKNEYKIAVTDTSAINTLFQIGRYFNRIDKDSSIYYYKKIINITEKKTSDTIMQNVNAEAYMKIALAYYRNRSLIESKLYYNKVIKLFKKLNKKNNNIINCYGNLANCHLLLSEYDSALINYNHALKLAVEIQDSSRIMMNYVSLGNVYQKKGEFENSLKNYITGLRKAERLKNERFQSVCLNSIGVIYWNIKEFEKAVEYLNKAIKIKTKINDKRGISACLLNMGLIYSDQKNYETAIDYYTKALKIKEELSDKRGVSKCYNNIGNAYKNTKDYKLAINYYLKASEIKKENNDLEGIALVSVNISELFLTIADSTNISNSQKQEYYKKSIEYGLQSLKISQEIDAKPWINLSTSILSKAYKDVGNFKKSTEYLELYIKNNNLMFSEDKANAITEMESKYQTEKKQLEIEKLEKEQALKNETIARQNAENKKQTILLFSFIIGFVLILIIAIVIFKMLSQKRKANILLSLQKREISEKNEELNQLVEEVTAQRDEIEAQRDVVTSQKKEIEHIYNEISESITYATSLQKAILPEDMVLENSVSDYFTLFKPKDNVSGDFYWWTNIENYTVITAADSTGHGVPGAFMSLLGILFLKEIVQKGNITDTGLVLTKLREEIIKALKQKQEIGGQKDGMDMALITINNDTNVIQYSGANNPLYLVRNSELQILNNDNNVIKLYDNSDKHSKLLYEIKPNKMPIAIYRKMSDFNTVEIQLEKGDQIYMFSDGFSDQFGGEKGKKFKYKPFKELILKNSDKPMKEQKEILENTFNSWKGKFMQIDDVLVMGIKL